MRKRNAIAQVSLGALSSATMHTMHLPADGTPRQRLCVAFAAACARENVRATLREAQHGLAVEFADQEEAPRDLILHHFGLELAAAGVGSDEILRPRDDLTEAHLQRLVQGLDTAIRR